MRHPLLKSVQWKDLIQLNVKEVIIENSITLPWLVSSWLFAYYEWYIPAVICSFFLFLTGLRLVHNACHNALGVGKVLNNWAMFSNSALLMASIHAVKHTHLIHHRHCLEEHDLEGKCAKLNAFRALCYGPLHVFNIHKTALKSVDRNLKTWVIAEMLLVSSVVFVAIFFHIKFLIYHCVVMALGELTTAFFAVWTVHHDCDDEFYARSLTKKWKNIISYNMFYHWEHHQFPAVPTIKLPELANRIGKEVKGLEIKQVF